MLTKRRSSSLQLFGTTQKLTNIISDGISRLDKYETIDKKYNKFEKDHKTTFFNYKDFVEGKYFNRFKDYKWYYNKVIETDERLKQEKKERDEKRRKKEELDSEV